MANELIPSGPLATPQTASSGLAVPALIDQAGQKARKRFLEFFIAQYRNPNTREAYARAVGRFLDWCTQHGLPDLDYLEPLHVAAYVEELGQEYKVRTVKQHLAAIRMCFDYLVTGGILPTNPALHVRGPKLVSPKGVTPVLEDDQVLDLLDSIDISTIVGLRDRAILGTMLFSWARVSAVCGLHVRDYESSGRKTHLFLGEKGGKEHRVLLHHKAEEFIDVYVDAAGIADDREGWLFRAVNRARERAGDLPRRLLGPYAEKVRRGVAGPGQGQEEGLEIDSQGEQGATSTLADPGVVSDRARAQGSLD